MPDATDRLVELLDERSSLYAGRRANEVELLRARILTRLEQHTLPSDGVVFVLEELESGTDPATVAAAGRALRGTSKLPPEAPKLLVEAMSRLRGSDDVLAPDPHRPDLAVTALEDLAGTLVQLGFRARSALPALRALLGQEGDQFSPPVRATLVTAAEALTRPAAQPTASCCLTPPAPASRSRPAGRRDPASLALAGALEVEDQNGNRLTLTVAFAGRPTALAFFYTRCMNPDKCSRTVTRLARLSQLIESKGLAANVAGISYDPAFDRPERLRQYGADRGMHFSPRCSLLRTAGPLEPLVEALGLGVGFGPVTVNRHQVELYLLDRALRVRERLERRLWDEYQVHKRLHELA